MVEQRIKSEVQIRVLVEPMDNPLGVSLGVSPSKGNQGTTQGKEKIFRLRRGIEPTTSGLDLPLLCRLNYEVGQRKSGTILGGESRRRESKGTCCAAKH